MVHPESASRLCPCTRPQIYITYSCRTPRINTRLVSVHSRRSGLPRAAVHPVSTPDLCLYTQGDPDYLELSYTLYQHQTCICTLQETRITYSCRTPCINPRLLSVHSQRSGLPKAAVQFVSTPDLCLCTHGNPDYLELPYALYQHEACGLRKILYTCTNRRLA